jgi:hypothetical protein
LSTVTLPPLAERLRRAAETAAMRALGDQDRDPASPTRGCFDRRYWAWKLVDCPEATFQRHVYPLVMLAQDPASRFYNRADVLEAIEAGLRFALSIQHRNGSFDQAFPFEQSWGATAFLLQPLIAALEYVRPALGRDADRMAEQLLASATFLRRQRERHGRITNHLAGGVLSLLTAGRVLNDRAATSAASELLGEILASQSAEGWFPEYGGADPGYQTLCVHYLAEVSAIAPSPELTRGLERAIEFLQWFVHPDGTLGGVYGSRRTRVAYPGGLALLAKQSPLAAALANALLAAAADERAVTVLTIDAGNLAPLLTSVVRALSVSPGTPASTPVLPRDRDAACVDFPDAGLHVRSTSTYYAVVGSGNGGTLTVFDRASGECLCDDGGYAGELADGRHVTSQVTGAHRVESDAGSVTVETTFVEMPHPVPTPAQFVLLRLLNLTMMRSVGVGNAIKRMLVARLIAPQGQVPLTVTRRFLFRDRVGIQDRFTNATGLAIRSLRGGRPFVSVHMASAGYYDGSALASRPSGAVEIDAVALSQAKSIEWAGEL